MLRAQAIEKALGRCAVRATFEVAAHRRLALTGPSGSGKTTILKILAGLVRPDSGHIFLNEIDITRLKPEERDVGMVFQDSLLFPHMNVMDNATFGLKLRGVPLSERKKLGAQWLSMAGIQVPTDSPVTNLSGGEKQRVALVRGLIWRPKYILLDEPFSGLDLARKKDLCARLVELHSACPVPFVFVTHDQEDLGLLAHQIYAVGEG